MYSSKLSVQILGEVLKEYGVLDIVISPGSRNAPLTIHFSNYKEYTCYSVVDERSAGFFALGLAQAKQKPVVLCCTSGSASANYYPAIIEAFYQNTPLIVITADRPEDFVDIFDGQTIRQVDLYKNHIYHSVSIAEEESTESLTENFLKVKKAVGESIVKSGPVHINMPFSDPLYEQVEKIEFQIDALSQPMQKFDSDKWLPTVVKCKDYKKKLVLVGMHDYDAELEALLVQLAEREDVVILTEVTANIQSDSFYQNIDRYIDANTKEKEAFAPDLLITIGQNVVSKKVKQFLRAVKPKGHWHIDKYWHPDTYFCLTEKIQDEPVYVLREILDQETASSNYSSVWKELKEQKDKRHNEYISSVGFSDFKVFDVFSKNIPIQSHIQFSNSSSIRYGQLFDFDKFKSSHCNRGASGIDGSTSTAVGYAVGMQEQTVLITGDIGFFYDSNAFWNNYIRKDFRVILLNNGGGDIFNYIPGPDTTQENTLSTYFLTTHDRTAGCIANDYGFEHSIVKNEVELEQALSNFFDLSEQPKILEVDTKSLNNSEILREYFKYLVKD